MEVTPLGIIKEVAVLPIAYCNNDINVTTLPFFVQEYKLPSLLLLVKPLLPGSTTMDVNLEQLVKALFPMEVTLEGIVTLGNEVQLSKALFPMEVTLAGIVTLVNEVQLLKALFPMEVTLEPIVIAVIVVLP